MNKIHTKSDAKYIDIHHNDVVNVDISTKEPVSEDLKEAASKFHDHPIQHSNGIVWENGYREGCSMGFIFGANWQKERDFQDMLKSDHTEFIKCYEQGKTDMKEQMMKDAINADAVYHSGDGTLFSPEILPDYVNPGDKVKLIIIKED